MSPRGARSLTATLLLAGMTGCAAMHAQQVDNLRADGQHARADCYELCDPSDLMCLKDCDNAHPRQMSEQQQQQLQQLVDLQAASSSMDPPAGNQPSSNQAPTVTSTTSSSSSQRTLTINGQTYTGGEHLGRPCGLDNPCPDGYKCHLVTDQSGQCVQ